MLMIKLLVIWTKQSGGLTATKTGISGGSRTTSSKIFVYNQVAFVQSYVG
jgi:hypothetical protein